MNQTFPSTISLKHYGYENMLQLQNSSNWFDNQYISNFDDAISKQKEKYIENEDNNYERKFRYNNSLVLKDVIASELLFQTNDMKTIMYDITQNNDDGFQITKNNNNTQFDIDGEYKENITNYSENTIRKFNKKREILNNGIKKTKYIQCNWQTSSESYSSSDWFNPSGNCKSFKKIPKMRPSSKNLLSSNSLATITFLNNSSESNSEKSLEMFKSPYLKVPESIVQTQNMFDIKRENSPVIKTEVVCTGGHHRVYRPRPHKRKSFTIITDKKSHSSRGKLEESLREASILESKSLSADKETNLQISSSNLKLPTLVTKHNIGYQLIKSDELPRLSVKFDMSTKNAKTSKNEYLKQSFSSVFPAVSTKLSTDRTIFSKLKNENCKFLTNPTSQQKGFLRVVSSADSISKTLNKTWNFGSLENVSTKSNPHISSLEKVNNFKVPVRRNSIQTGAKSSAESDQRSSNLTSFNTSDFSLRRNTGSLLKHNSINNISEFNNTFKQMQKHYIVKKKFNTESKSLKLNKSSLPKKKNAISSQLSPIIGTPNKDNSLNQNETDATFVGFLRKNELNNSNTSIPIKNDSNISILKHTSRADIGTSSSLFNYKTTQKDSCSSSKQSQTNVYLQSLLKATNLPNQLNKTKLQMKKKIIHFNKIEKKELEILTKIPPELLNKKKIIQNHTKSPNFCQNQKKKIKDLKKITQEKSLKQPTINISSFKSRIPKIQSAKKKLITMQTLEKKKLTKRKFNANLKDELNVSETSTNIISSKEVHSKQYSKNDLPSSKNKLPNLINIKSTETKLKKMENNNEIESFQKTNIPLAKAISYNNLTMKLAKTNKEKSDTTADNNIKNMVNEVSSNVTNKSNEVSSKISNEICINSAFIAVEISKARTSELDKKNKSEHLIEDNNDKIKRDVISQDTSLSEMPGAEKEQTKTEEMLGSLEENLTAPKPIKNNIIGLNEENSETIVQFQKSTNLNGIQEDSESLKNIDNKNILVNSPNQPMKSTVALVSNDNLNHPSSIIVRNNTNENLQNNNILFEDMAERISERAISILPDVECESSNLQNFEQSHLVSKENKIEIIEEIKEISNILEEKVKENSPNENSDKSSHNNSILHEINLNDEELLGCFGRLKYCKWCSSFCIPFRRCQCFKCRKSTEDNIEIVSVIVKEVNEKVPYKKNCWKCMKCFKINDKVNSEKKIVQPWHIDYISEEQETSTANSSESTKKIKNCILCMRKMFCCRATNKVENSTTSVGVIRYCCCISYKSKKQDNNFEHAWQESILNEPVMTAESLCTRILNKCRKKKNTFRKASIASRKQSLAPTNPPEDTRLKLHNDLVDYNSKMKAAIPVLPIYFAYFCTVFNIVIPGLGTILSGIFCLCVGIPRFSQYDSAKARVGAFVINIFVGVAQFFCVIFCFVGWGWSVWWGSIMMKSAKKLQKIRKVEKLEVEEEQRQATLAAEKKDAETANT